MWRLWLRLGRPQARAFILSLTIGAGAAAAGVALLALSGWFLAAAGAAGAAGAALAFNHLYPSAGVRALAIARVGLRYAEQLSGHAAILKLAAHVRPATFQGLARQSVGLRPLSHDVLAAVLDDVNAVEGGFLRVIAPIAASLAGFCVAIIVLAMQDAFSALVALVIVCAGVAAGAALLHAARRDAQGLGRAHADAMAREEAGALFQSLDELYAFGAVGAVRLRVDAACEAALQATLRADRVARWRAGFPATFAGLASVGVLALGVQLGWSPPTGAAVALAFLAALGAFTVWASALEALPRAQAAAKQLLRSIDGPDAVRQPPDEMLPPPECVLPIVAQGLVVRPAAGAASIGPISFTLEAGSVVQLLGPSGAGKSTILEALMRLRNIDDGTLLYRDQSADTVRAAGLRRRMAYCAQHPSFLAGSIRDALAYGRPDATDDVLWASLKAVGLAKMVRALPLQLDSLLTEGGIGFSGGESRRLSLARALTMNPEILLLDEPLSGLDAAASTDILAAIEAWRRETNGALVVAAHAALALSGLVTEVWLSPKTFDVQLRTEVSPQSRE